MGSMSTPPPATGSNPAAIKTALRAELRSQVMARPKANREAASAQIVERVLQSRPFSHAHAVLAFMPLADEPDVTPILERILALGKTLILPRIISEAPSLALHRIDGLHQLTHRNPELPRLREPDPAACPLLEPAAVDLAIVPGVGFIRRHALPHYWRLGRGGAHYDRLLAVLPKRALRIGCFFDCQEIHPPSRLPLQAHDQALDGIATEAHLHLPAHHL